MLRNTPLYSIRMRAAEGGAHEQGGRHISGGERLGTKEMLLLHAAELLEKSLTHSRGDSDFIQLTLEKIDAAQIRKVAPLPVATEHVSSVLEGRETAALLLSSLGISAQAIHHGLNILKQSTNLRGAAILHGDTGERLDQREWRGVRVTRMDWDPYAFGKWIQLHPALESARVREALALATKVAHAPYTMAELCWSDDPDYVTGYVACKELGYKRITHLKELGDCSGGRIFFVSQEVNLEEYMDYMEKTPVWIG